MKRITAILCLAFFSAVPTLAQEQNPSADGKVDNKTALSKDDKSLYLESGTRLAAQLQGTLDARKAKAGDLVVLKTTEAVKRDGAIVLNKGARVVGHLTEVQQRKGGDAMSKLSIAFDYVENGGVKTPISATILAITQPLNNAALNSNATADSTLNTTGSTQVHQRSSGGLLGGATNTVGGVVNQTTNAVGGAVNATTDTVTRTTAGAGRTLSNIRIAESDSTTTTGASTLTLQGGPIRLEKGTSFNLALNQAMTVKR